MWLGLLFFVFATFMLFNLILSVCFVGCGVWMTAYMFNKLVNCRKSTVYVVNLFLALWMSLGIDFASQVVKSGLVSCFRVFCMGLDCFGLNLYGELDNYGQKRI